MSRTEAVEVLLVCQNSASRTLATKSNRLCNSIRLFCMGVPLMITLNPAGTSRSLWAN